MLKATLSVCDLRGLDPPFRHRDIKATYTFFIIIPGNYSYVPLVSPTSNSTIISIIFIDLALTPSINKDNLSSFDSNNNPSTSPFIDSLTEPCLVPKVCSSYVLQVD